MKTNIFPVIHFLNESVALDQARIACEAGADGVFLISHRGEDLLLGPVGAKIKSRWPTLDVGLNFLQQGVLEATDAVNDHGLDMVWGDACGVSSEGLTAKGNALRRFAREFPGIAIYASVAFKYQPVEHDPAAAAQQARDAGFLPTTSGAATGAAPELAKIRAMAAEGPGGPRLAVASGMTAQNVAEFAPYLSAILVATGVSFDEHHFDSGRLDQFVTSVRAAARDHAHQ